jgi:SAM-dependent methyltransferase
VLRPTFRDPAGSVVIQPDRVLRLLNEQGASELDAFLETRFSKSFAGRLIETLPTDVHVVEHPRIWFPSYPYEWPAEMLHSAASLTLDLARAALAENWQLKDATPYNVLFDGPNPIFVDVCSFERRDPRRAVWHAYGQFARTFLNPLIAHRTLKLPTAPLFLLSRDGLESEELYRWTPVLKRWLSSLLFSLTLPAQLSRVRRSKSADGGREPEQALFILKRLLNGVQSRLRDLTPTSTEESRWTGYMGTFTYDAAQFDFKSGFVGRMMARVRPKRTLDIGCNTGHFSRVAAAAGSRVIALDRDAAVIGRLWRIAAQDRLDIQPLVADFARPTPAVGWRNAECSSLLSRLEQAEFEMTLVLGTLHHLTVTDRIPLDQLLELLASLTTHAIVEYVGPEDEMFQFLSRGNEALYRDVTPQSFELECEAHFEIVEAAPIPGSSRRLYLLKSLRR